MTWIISRGASSNRPNIKQDNVLRATQVLPSSRQLPRKEPVLLSYEVIALIAKHLFEVSPPSGSTSAQNEDICCSKPRWADISGFMSASPELHRIGYQYWVTVLSILTQDDWDEAVKISVFIRELRCADGVFTAENQNILSLFPKLCAAVVDSHSDVQTNSANRFAYRSLFTRLPSSLRRLEIKHAHGPDINVISTIKRWCPDLEELRLGRCTMFNRAPACPFWQAFPFDHNSYISDQGIDAYTHSLGHELAPLRKLCAIRLGVYLMASDLVIAHRVFHSRGLVAPNEIDWQQALQVVVNTQMDHVAGQQTLPQVHDLVSLLHRPLESEHNFSVDSCSFCYERSYDATKQAQESANTILKQSIPSLERAEWMSWFTPNHSGVSAHCYVPASTSSIKEQHVFN